MMTSLGWALAWCAVQVGILAGLGLVAAWALRRRSPAAAATATAAAAGMVGVVTLLAPAPMPRLLGEWPGSNRAKAQAAGQAADATVSAPEADEPALSLLDLVNGAVRLMEASKGGGVETPARWWVTAGIVAAGAAWGIWRFLEAWRYVAGLRRSATVVECSAAKRVFEELVCAMGIRRTVALCQSPAVVSPAVLGWRRPIVLLPTTHSAWSGTQLRAALAHELAHVARGDFFWRATASVALAIHFYHPLVHWLTRRLALVQELAADERAAAASGGAAAYVRALSQLAIRLDDGPRLRAEPLVLPAFNSNLIRRITMLRSKDEVSCTVGRRYSGMVAAGFIVLVGVGTVALRSAAQATPNSPQATAAAAAMFQRPALDASIVSGIDQGIFVVRVGELAKLPSFAAAFGLLNESCRQHWERVFGGPAPELRMEAVEFVAGVPVLTIKPMSEEAKKTNPNANGWMMIGCEEFVVRFSNPVDWRAWAAKHIPLAKEKTLEGFTYLEMPATPVFGSVPLLAAARDERTVVVTGGNVELLRRSATASGATPTVGRAAEWASLDGGLATFVSSNAKVDRNTPTPEAPQAQVVLEHVKRYGMGFDLDAATNMASVRFDLGCADAASAEQVRAAIGELLPIAIAKFQAEAENPAELKLDEEEQRRWEQTAGNSDTDRKIAEFWRQAAKTCEASVIGNEDGTARVRLVGTATFPDHLVTAHEVAERPNAATNSTR